MQVRAATAGDFNDILSLITDAGLPTDDLDIELLADFLVAETEHGLRAVIGLEPHGSVGLLRSLVVERGARSANVGRQLVSALEQHARDRGVEELWLLTTDADGYFALLGYDVAERKDAPSPIRDSAQFSSLCPDDAVLMRKRLD